jgi:hypothetical protein
MKTRITCACIVILIFTAACTSTADNKTPFNKDSKTPMTMGYYSLMYMPTGTEETNNNGKDEQHHTVSLRSLCGTFM